MRNLDNSWTKKAKYVASVFKKIKINLQSTPFIDGQLHAWKIGRGWCKSTSVTVNVLYRIVTQSRGTLDLIFWT